MAQNWQPMHLSLSICTVPSGQLVGRLGGAHLHALGVLRSAGTGWGGSTSPHRASRRPPSLGVGPMRSVLIQKSPGLNAVDGLAGGRAGLAAHAAVEVGDDCVVGHLDHAPIPLGLAFEAGAYALARGHPFASGAGRRHHGCISVPFGSHGTGLPNGEFSAVALYTMHRGGAHRWRSRRRCPGRRGRSRTLMLTSSKP